MIFESVSGFHILCINALNVRMLVSKHFQPGEGPSKGLLCDCEIFAYVPSFEALPGTDGGAEPGS